MKVISLFMLLFAFLFFSNILLGEDIKTLDGTVYKNADVINTMPDGILVNFAGKNGFNTVKLLKFNDLPVSIQKKYGYDPKKAENFEKEHHEWLNKQQALEKKKKEEYAAKREQEKMKAKERQEDNNTDKNKSQKEKLNSLIDNLDKMSDKNKQPDGSSGTGDSSIGNLMEDAVSSTESQTKEIDKLTQ
jgi:hypothetical protein